MIFFFESHSILQTLTLFFKVRKARALCYHPGNISYTHRFKNYVKSDKHKNAVLRLAKAINRNVEIREISQCLTNEYSWTSNKESPSVIDRLRPEIENSAPYRIIRLIIGDDNIIKYYQHHLAQGHIANKISFLRMSRDLIPSNDLVVVVPAEYSFFRLVSMAIGTPPDLTAPPVIEWLNRLFDFGRRIKYSVVITFFPSLYMAREILRNGFTTGKTSKKKCDVLQTVTNGFKKEDNRSGASFVTDDFLYKGPMALRNILFVFSRRDSERIKKESNAIMDEKGIIHVDVGDYKINGGMMCLCLKIQLKILLNVSTLFSMFRAPPIFIEISWRALYDYLKKMLEMEYVETKVELCRNDMNPDHVIRTIILNKYGNTTVGVQHNSTAGPYVAPQLCYAHFDKYCIYSDAHLRLHSPYWETMKLAKTGSIMMDEVIELSNDEKRLNRLKAKMVSLYGDKEHTILIAFPNPRPYSLIEKWDEMYNGLLEFKDLEIDANIFLRFRNREQFLHPIIKRFTHLPEKDDRIIIDHINFTTHELMALCNTYITSSHSSGIIEAAAIGKKAFTFDYMGTAKHCFSRYGKDLILNKKNDVLELFKNLENNQAEYDCRWDLIRKEYNYYYDGGCLARLKNMVGHMLKEEN